MGSIDPPRILDGTLKDVSICNFDPLCVITSILTPLSEIPNEAFVNVALS